MEITKETSPTCNELNQIFKEAGVPYGCTFIGSSVSSLSAFAVHTYKAGTDEPRHLHPSDVTKLSNAFSNSGVRVVDINEAASLQAYPRSAMMAQQVNPFALVLRRRAKWQDGLSLNWRGLSVLKDVSSHSTAVDVANDMNIAFSVYNISRLLLLTKRPALLRNLRIGK